MIGCYASHDIDEVHHALEGQRCLRDEAWFYSANAGGSVSSHMVVRATGRYPSKLAGVSVGEPLRI